MHNNEIQQTKNILQFHADGRTEGPYPVTMEVTYPHVLPEVTI